MRYVESPDTTDDIFNSVFLAGGISGCYDWQSKVVAKLDELKAPVTVFNPRRKNFDIKDKDMTMKQIYWEYVHLRQASFIVFWFCKETECPITLFELGQHSMTNKTIIIGIDPEYKRRRDVEIQMGLVRPDIPIVYTLNDLVNNIHTQTVLNAIA